MKPIFIILFLLVFQVKSGKLTNEYQNLWKVWKELHKRSYIGEEENLGIISIKNKAI